MIVADHLQYDTGRVSLLQYEKIEVYAIVSAAETLFSKLRCPNFCQRGRLDEWINISLHFSLRHPEAH